MQRALGDAEQSAFEQSTGSEGTILLEEYYVHKKIRMIDTRGFFESDEKLLDECLRIMSGRWEFNNDNNLDDNNNNIDISDYDNDHHNKNATSNKNNSKSNNNNNNNNNDNMSFYSC